LIFAFLKVVPAGRRVKEIEIENILMTLKENRTLVLRFRIEGSLRYLSHAETMTMFQRAFRRAGIELCYSRGYNPRPKLSLPLPRSVGVLSDDELLCASVNPDAAGSSADAFTDAIRPQLPEGCEVTSIELVDSKVSPKPVTVVYEFTLAESATALRVDKRVDRLRDRLAEGEPIYVYRQGGKRRASRSIDVGPYIESLGLTEETLQVECNITPSGSIRIDEILGLLEIEPADLAAVRRKSVQWRN
jgi:radical SAM-linked protein